MSRPVYNPDGTLKGVGRPSLAKPTTDLLRWQGHDGDVVPPITKGSDPARMGVAGMSTEAVHAFEHQEMVHTRPGASAKMSQIFTSSIFPGISKHTESPRDSARHANKISNMYASTVFEPEGAAAPREKIAQKPGKRQFPQVALSPAASGMPSRLGSNAVTACSVSAGLDGHHDEGSAASIGLPGWAGSESSRSAAKGTRLSHRGHPQGVPLSLSAWQPGWDQEMAVPDRPDWQKAQNVSRKALQPAGGVSHVRLSVPDAVQVVPTSTRHAGGRSTLQLG